MQSVLQAGLSSGMAATAGLHSAKPNHVDSSFDGTKALLPQDFIPQTTSRITLKGKYENVEVPYMSIGAWSWGDTATWHWNNETEEPRLLEAWELLKREHVTWIDTAQVYGNGDSERLCGKLFRGMNRNDYVIQTKWDVVPTMSDLQHGKHAPTALLKESLERFGLDQIDIYMVHGPIHAQSISAVAKALSECVEQRLTKCVAVANYSKEDMIEMYNELQKYGIPLASNQTEFSILRRLPESSGLLEACRERGIVHQAYSSIAQGKLSGKYNESNPPPKTYRFSNYKMSEIQPVLDVVDSIAQKHQTNMAAVALNYVISKGSVPVIGIRSPGQVEQNLKAFGWRLDLDDIKKLDATGFEGHATKLWQQG